MTRRVFHSLGRCHISSLYSVRSSGFPVKTASWYRCVLELSPPPSLFYFPGGVRLDV
jgi:hypothetical protein